MRNNIKVIRIVTSALLFGTAACGTGAETAPEASTRAQIVEPVRPPAGVTSEDNCEQVARWVDQNRDALPSTYDEIVRFPDQYRGAIFGALQPEMQSALFRAQIARFRFRQSLTDEQLAVLNRADTLMSPALYTKRDSLDPDTVEMMHDLERRSTAAFGLEEARALIAHLGPPEETTPEETTADPPVRALDRPYCGCSTSSDWCFVSGKTCRVIPCISTNRCGSGLIYRCNGVCGGGL
jgi:hypothetical protein